MNRSGNPNHNRPPLNSSASNSSTDNNDQKDNAYKAALRGASLAFQNTGSKAQSAVPAQARPIDNRALLAATSTAHHYGLSPSRSPPRARSSTVSRQTTGSSVRSSAGTTGGHEVDYGAVAQGLQQRPAHTAAQHLMPPGKQQAGPDAKSPSFIAATLAASRSGSPSSRQAANPPHPYQQAARRQRAHSAATSVASLDLNADTAPLPSTNALISMFEKKDDKRGDAGPVGDPVKKQVAPSSSNKPPISKPKPKPKPRPVTPPKGVDVVKQPIISPAVLASPPVRDTPKSLPGSVSKPTSGKPETKKVPTGKDTKRPPPTPPPPRSSTNQVEESPSERAVLPKRKPRASTPPRPRSIASANTSILSPQPRRTSSQKILSHRSSDDDDTVAFRPKPPPAVKPKPQRRASVQHVEKPSVPREEESPRPIVLVDEEERRPSSSSSNDTFVSAESEPSPQPALPRRRGNVPSTPDPPRIIRPATAQGVPSITTTTSYSQSRRLLAPPPPLPQRQQQKQQQHQSTGLPLDSLTNAIVAGSLASSRFTPSNNSKLKPPSPPPSRRQTPLRMRQTLREPTSSSKKNKSDDDDSEATRRHKHRHRKKPFAQKGKHAHHEGQRKRWREEITPRERKRYEGVWASNRGYLLVDNRDRDRPGMRQQNPQSSSLSLSPSQSRSLNLTQSQTQTRPSRDAPSTSSQRAIMSTEVSNGSSGDVVITRYEGGGDGQGDGDLVANVVVRDLWARSRLPADELAEVWDLVDGRRRGALDRAEFVVGTWLVDQRLRGRKIPRKVSDSVWSSARSGGAGVRVRVKGVKGK